MFCEAIESITESDQWSVGAHFDWSGPPPQGQEVKPIVLVGWGPVWHSSGGSGEASCRGFCCCCSLVINIWHTTVQTNMLKRWKATISFLLRVFQEVKALRCCLWGNWSEIQKLVSWSAPSLRTQLVLKRNILYLDDMGGTGGESFLKRPQLWGHFYSELGQIRKSKK